MGKISITNYGTNTLSAGGITVPVGGSHEFPDACSLVRFVNASGGVVLESVPGEVVDRVNELAAAEGCPDRVRGEVVTPTEGEPQPGSPQQGDTPQQQGAPPPQPGAQVDVQPGPHGEPGDTRQPTESMHDRRDPQSEGQIREGEEARGATPEAAADAAERARRGDPPPGEARATHGGERTPAPTRGGDPIDLFSGRLVLDAVDLDVPTPFIPIQLRRHYVSGLPVFGPWGFNWDHNWNVFLRELASGNVARWNGRPLHEDEFRWVGDHYEPPRGVLELLERDPGPGTAYTIRARHGVAMRFARPPGWTDAERIPLVAVEDRARNRVALAYDTENRLAAVIDQDGRGLRFTYGRCGRLEAVEDHAGRRVTYQHDQATEHLVAVRLPPTPDFPDGLLTRYEYDASPGHPAFRHNVLRVLDHHGDAIVQCEYGQDPAHVGWNRVVRQIQGAHVYDLTYQQIQYVPADELYVNAFAMQTTVATPDRALWVYTFNYRGDVLDERVRLNHDGSYRVVITKRAFDPQGNLAELTQPDGARTVYTYDHANADPRMRGNLVRVELRAPPTIPAPSRIVLRADYEPRLQLPRRFVAEGGAITQIVYDFDASPDPSNRGDTVRIEWPDATLPDGTVQPAVTRFETNARGQTTAMISPEGTRDEWVYVAAGALAGFVAEYRADAGGVDEITRYTYDAAGYLRTRQEPGGATYAFLYGAHGSLHEVALPAVDGVVDRIRYRYGAQGRLAHVERPRGEYTDAAITEPFLRDSYATDPLGFLREVVIGANTARPRRFAVQTDHAGRPVSITDPEGTVTRRCYDERGLLLYEERASGTPLATRTEQVYDLAGRLARSRGADGQAVEYAYDAWGRVQRTRLPTGTVMRSEWSEYNLLTRQEVDGDPGDGGPARPLRRLEYAYDERGRLVLTTLVAFAGDPSAATAMSLEKWYDRDGRVVRRVGPRGAVWTLAWDGRNRCIRVDDPEGNRRERTYGPDGELRRLAWIDAGPGGPAARFVDLAHDARGRLRATRTSLGNVVETAYDARDLVVRRWDELGVETRFARGLLGEELEVVTDPGGLGLSYAHAHDALGRPVAFRDPTGEVTRVERDALGRITAVRLADGGVHRRAFAATGQLARIEAPDGSALELGYDATGVLATLTPVAGPGRAAVPVHALRHDGVGRLVGIEAGGVAIERRYDSLDRLIEETIAGRTFRREIDDAAGAHVVRYPSGRAERQEVDRLGRVRRVVLEAAGASAVAGAAGAPGAVLLDAAFRGEQVVARLTIDGAVTTEQRHDGELRLLRVEHRGGGGALAGGTVYRYDARGLRRVAVPLGPEVPPQLYTYDARRRLVVWRRGFAAPPIGAAPEPATQAEQDADTAVVEAAAGAVALRQEYALDGADTRLAVTTAAGGPLAVVPYAQAPGHRVVGVGGAAIAYDADGRRTRDAAWRYTYDALGRPVAIAPAGGGAPVARFEYDPAGRLLAVIDAAGARRQLHFGGLRLVEEDAGGAVIAEHTQHPLLAVPAIETAAAGRRYLQYDGHLDLTLVSGAGGGVLERYRYDAFGAPEIRDPSGAGVRAASAIGMAPRFGGLPWLAGAGRYLAPERLYDPDTGLFLARDPFLHLASASPYTYGGHDPINRVDLEGEIAPLLLAGLILGGIGALFGAGSVILRGGDYDFWDVLAGAAIGFGAGFIGGVTFGAVSAWVGGALLSATAGTSLAGAAWVGTAISVTSGVVGGAASGLLSGAFSGGAGGAYGAYRGGGDVGEAMWAGAREGGVSGMAAGAVSGGLFQGLTRVGTIPRGSWSAVLGQSPSVARSAVLPSVIGRGLVSPYGPLGAGGIGFAGGYTGGVVRGLMRGQDLEDAATDALAEGGWGAATSIAGTALHPTTWEYWNARLSVGHAQRIQALRPGETHHQRNVAQYPEFANPQPTEGRPLGPLTRLNNAITRGNIEGPWSEYMSDPNPAARHRQLHDAWRFGQTGNWTNWSTHGPWTPAWNVANVPVDPRATSHRDKPE